MTFYEWYGKEIRRPATHYKEIAKEAWDKQQETMDKEREEYNETILSMLDMRCCGNCIFFINNKCFFHGKNIREDSHAYCKDWESDKSTLSERIKDGE